MTLCLLKTSVAQPELCVLTSIRIDCSLQLDSELHSVMLTLRNGIRTSCPYTQEPLTSKTGLSFAKGSGRLLLSSSSKSKMQ